MKVNDLFFKKLHSHVSCFIACLHYIAELHSHSHNMRKLLAGKFFQIREQGQSGRLRSRDLQ